MKTFYCVTTTFDDLGRVTAAITSEKQAQTKPQSSNTSTSRKDIYNDWFQTRKEAVAFIKEAKNA